MTDFFERVAALRREGQSFAVATVVARRAPVSAHLGDRAIIFADGRMEGFVGGACSREIVRRQARESLAMRLGRLVSIRPDAVAVSESTPEHVVVPMTCASEGAIDVYIEPFVRARTLVVVGATPVAGAVARLARALEYDVVRVVDAREQSDLEPEAAALGMRVVALDTLEPYCCRIAPSVFAVVASQGHYDEEALGAILKARPAYVGLVASRKRGATVRGVLEESGATRHRDDQDSCRPGSRGSHGARGGVVDPGGDRPDASQRHASRGWRRCPARSSHRRCRRARSIRSAAWTWTWPRRGTRRRSMASATPSAARIAARAS